jgi:hypothetical protein
MPLNLIDTTATAQRQPTVEILREGRTAEKLDKAADNALAFAGILLEGVLDKVPPERPVACKEACSWCCLMVVQTTIPELIRVARHLRHTLTDTHLADLRRRIDEVLDELPHAAPPLLGLEQPRRPPLPDLCRDWPGSHAHLPAAEGNRRWCRTRGHSVPGAGGVVGAEG